MFRDPWSLHAVPTCPLRAFLPALVSTACAHLCQLSAQPLPLRSALCLQSLGCGASLAGPEVQVVASLLGHLQALLGGLQGRAGQAARSSIHAGWRFGQCQEKRTRPSRLGAGSAG